MTHAWITCCVISACFLFNLSKLAAQLHVDEQHRIFWHDEQDIPRHSHVPGAAPVTVAADDSYLTERLLPLDEAIRIALQHAEVIRVLSGVSASSSGRTIYDPAIATTAIDQAVARFDPVFTANSTWRKTETPGTRVDPGDPLAALIAGAQTGGNDITARLAQTNRHGGTAALEVGNNWLYGEGGPGRLNPANRSAIDLSYTQPLLSGAGRRANEAPIVIARLELDRSYFQFKGSMQSLVQGVITAYWSLVEARTQLWAREKQVEQAKAAFDRAEAQFRAKLVDIRNVAQPKVAYFNFKANLVTARANLIQREAALRNLLGLPPEDGVRLVPSTPPTRNRIQFVWPELVATAQVRRPDLVELDLILLADQQRLIQARNQAQPTLNAIAIQRWNGLRGQMLNGADTSSGLDDNPAWTLGVNFEVPLTLRASRANARSTELLIARDRANLRQGLHNAEHSLATTVRSLEQFYEQYEAFRETRAAARINLQVQFAEQRARGAIFLNVLQAITDWGNAVSSEASSLTQYNSALASLERETGTILDTHGIVFTEERFRAIGPCGKHAECDCYPRSIRPIEHIDRYASGTTAAEEAFDLEDFPTSGEPKIIQPRLQPVDPADSTTPTEVRPASPATPPNTGRGLLKRMRLSRLFD